MPRSSRQRPRSLWLVPAVIGAGWWLVAADRGAPATGLGEEFAPSAPAVELAGAAQGGAAQGLRPADLRVLYTATLNGYVEPCGCVVGKTGGIDRVASAVQAQGEGAAAVLFVDGGDLFAEDPQVDPLLAEQLPLKADTLFGVWSELGCAAMALGDLDLVLGVPELQRLSRDHGIPILCANLSAEDGSRPFPASVVVERGGLRIGLFGLLAPELEAAGVKDHRQFDVAAAARAQGLVLEPYATAAAAVVGELAPQTDVLICLSHLGASRNLELARAHPELDLVLGGHFDTHREALTLIDGTPVTSSEIRGSNLNRVDFWFDDSYRESDGRGLLLDVSDRIVPAVEQAALLRGLQHLEGREAALGSLEWRTRDFDTRQALADVAARLGRRAPLPEQAAVSFALVPLSMSEPRSELALAAIDRYHRRVFEHWTSGPEGHPHPTRRFVGAEACVDCHLEQYEFWKATEHSRAFSTLMATEQQYDMECFRCHTVGFEAPSGFRHPNSSGGFENVQCEACHGGGGLHVAGGLSYVEPNLFPTPAQACVMCHDEDHDPRFNTTHAEKLALVACPPLGGPGQGTPTLLAKHRELAVALERAQPPQWEAANAQWERVGDLAAALAAAERWLAAQPQSIEARVVLAERCLAAEQAPRAVELLERVSRRRPNDARIWTGLAAARLATDDPAGALTAAREAISLAPGDLAVTMLLARSVAALGDLPSALQVLRLHLQVAPGDRAAVEPLIEELERSVH
jgi:hypothetical protein